MTKDGWRFLFALWVLFLLSSDPFAAAQEQTDPICLFAADDMLLNSKNFIAYPMATTAFQYYRSSPWPHGIIPVTFTDKVNPEKQRLFFETCSRWSKNAKVDCIARNQEPVFLTVDSDSNQKCQTTVGALPNARMNMSERCFIAPLLLHEIGHVMGLLHEHQRADRDRYIKVNLKNVVPDYRFAYAIVSNPDLEREPYDFLSIMHYPKRAYALDPRKDVMTPKSHYQDYTDKMGNQADLSTGDRKTMAEIYGVR